MKRTCSCRKQLDGTKPVESKDTWVNDYETCESEECFQRLMILCTKRRGKPNHIKTRRKLRIHVYSYKTPTKKARPNFRHTARKPEIILTLFITVLTISFLLLSTNSASVECYKLTTLDKMILLAVKLYEAWCFKYPLKQAFNFPFNWCAYPHNTRECRFWLHLVTIR